ncbi:hypothetical protein BRC71_06375 [Halobacteriales archaeon QH_7_65_31]|nr:MAG: hypothetical protein BRC71_06375 [Halobacteriales archaeon QH_7_65_31]
MGTSIGYLAFVPSLVGLDTALHALVAVLILVSIALLWALKEDIETEFDKLDSNLEADSDQPTQEPESATEKVTDGGYQRVRNLNVNKEEISGVPSVSGALIGGVLGALTGNPTVVAAAAGVGAVIGGGAEYSDLKEKHQEGIKSAAKAAVKQQQGEVAVEVVETGDAEHDDENYWQVVLKSSSYSGRETRHEVLVKRSDGSVWYQKDSNPYFE